MADKDKRRFWKTEWKSLPWPLLMIFLLLTFTIAVSGYFYYQKQKKDVFHEQITQLKAIADLKTTDIRNWFMERMGDAHLITENRILTAELLAFLRDRSTGPRRESIVSWMKSLRKNYHYQNVMLLDGSGKMALALTGPFPAIGSAGLELIEKVRKRKEAVNSDLHRSANVPFPHMDVAAPLLAAGTVEGFVFLRIDPNEFLYAMIQSWPTPSTSAETLLVRREGNEVVFLNELRHRKNTALNLRLPLTAKELPAAMAVQGETGAFSGRDYRGVAVWSVVRSIPDSPWFIVAKVDRDEIEHPVRRSALWMSIIVLSLILATAMLILLLWQRQNANYRLHLIELHQESEEKFKQVFETANVGKSITQLSGEININQAFCDMLGYSREELQKTKWQELTPVDEIESTQKMLEPLLQGRQDSARFNKRYNRKDGSIVWADVSVAIKRDPAGKPLHFITTVVDITERRQAEKTLHEIIDNAPFGAHLYELQPEGRLIFSGANRAADSILGVDSRQFVGKTIEEAFPSLIQTAIPDAYRRAAATGERYDTEQIEYVESGIQGAFEVHAFQTAPNRMATFFFDITERKQAEEALKKSQAQLNEAQRIAHVGNWDLNIVSNALTWSDEIYRIFKIDPKKFGASYNAFLDAIHPDDREAVNTAYSKSIKNRTPYSIDHRLLFPDGSVKYVHEQCETYYDADDKPLHSLGTVQDITERKQAEEALRESEKQVQRKLDTILSPEADIGTLELFDIIDSEKIQKLMDRFYQLTKIGIGIIDLHGRVLVGTGWQDICVKFHRINPAACQLCIESDLELSRNVQTGTFKLYRCKNNMWDIATPIMLGDRHVGNVFLGQFLFDNEKPDYETFRQQAHKYGFNEQKYLEALDRVPRWNREMVNAAMSFYTSFAEMIGRLSYSNIKLAKTLEERKRAEKEIQKLNTELEDRVSKRTAQLEAANKELEAFSYSVSHDLRAPLRAIDGFSRIVLEEYAPKLDDEGRRLIDVIRNNTHKMAQLIDDLLAFSRLSRQQIAFAPVDLSPLAETLFSELKSPEKGRHIEFKIRTLPVAFGDRSMLRQVLQNLLANAIKFTRTTPRARIEFSGQEGGSENIYQVKDNGVGFDMEYVDKLFGVFQRLHGSDEFEGTGVGLAIVQRIILRHGGRVWAESGKSGGATFYFALPAAAASETMAGEEKPVKIKVAP